MRTELFVFTLFIKYIKSSQCNDFREYTGLYPKYQYYSVTNPVFNIECCDFCEQDLNCKQYNYSSSNNECYLYNSSEVETSSSMFSTNIITRRYFCDISPGYTCASSIEPCYLDNNCLSGGHGCNAGGKKLCRFCGFGGHDNCPETTTTTIKWNHQFMTNYGPSTINRLRTDILIFNTLSNININISTGPCTSTETFQNRRLEEPEEPEEPGSTGGSEEPVAVQYVLRLNESLSNNSDIFCIYSNDDYQNIRFNLSITTLPNQDPSPPLLPPSNPPSLQYSQNKTLVRVRAEIIESLYTDTCCGNLDDCVLTINDYEVV